MSDAVEDPSSEEPFVVVNPDELLDSQKPAEVWHFVSMTKWTRMGSESCAESGEHAKHRYPWAKLKRTGDTVYVVDGKEGNVKQAARMWGSVHGVSVRTFTRYGVLEPGGNRYDCVAVVRQGTVQRDVVRLRKAAGGGPDDLVQESVRKNIKKNPLVVPPCDLRPNGRYFEPLEKPEPLAPPPLAEPPVRVEPPVPQKPAKLRLITADTPAPPAVKPPAVVAVATVVDPHPPAV